MCRFSISILGVCVTSQLVTLTVMVCDRCGHTSIYGVNDRIAADWSPFSAQASRRHCGLITGDKTLHLALFVCARVSEPHCARVAAVCTDLTAFRCLRRV